MIDWQTFLDDVAALLAAAFLGGLIGLEREAKGRWAGLRTNMLVSLGAALLVSISLPATKEDPAELTRVIQGIATGVGFIGAGTIVKLTDRMEVRGLTTASVIWLTAAVGTACGMRAYELAISATIAGMFILTGLRRAEKSLERLKDRRDRSKETTAVRKEEN